MKQIKCPGCGSTAEFDDDLAVFRCAYCGSQTELAANNRVSNSQPAYGLRLTELFASKDPMANQPALSISPLQVSTVLVLLLTAFYFCGGARLTFQWAFGRPMSLRADITVSAENEGYISITNRDGYDWKDCEILVTRGGEEFPRLYLEQDGFAAGSEKRFALRDLRDRDGNTFKGTARNIREAGIKCLFNKTIVLAEEPYTNKDALRIETEVEVPVVAAVAKENTSISRARAKKANADVGIREF